MFVVVYRWRLKPEKVDTFAAAWSCVTSRIRERCGSYGSALFESDDGIHTAIALWPDRDSRERCDIDAEDDLAIMSASIAENFPEQCLEDVQNLWYLPARNP